MDDRKCPYCVKVFSTKFNLRIHLERKVCQKKSQGDVRCPVCGNLYTNKGNMAVHLRKKHPEQAPKKRPHRLSDIIEYKCCGETFANGRALNRHRNNVHFQSVNDGTGNRSDEDEEPPIKKKVHYCSTCFKGYPSRLTLLRHEMEVHNAPGPSNVNAESEDVRQESEGDPYSDVDSKSSESEESDSQRIDSNKRVQHLLDSPTSLFCRIGVPIVDKAGRKTFNTVRHRWSFRLTRKALKLCEEGFSMEVLRAVIKELFKKISKKRGRIQIKIMSDYLDYPIVVPLFKISLFDPLMLLNYIESVLSLKDKLAIDQPLTIEVIHVSEMEGGGVELNPMTASGFLKRRNGCWDPGNVGQDHRCLTFCLAAWILIKRKRKSDKNFTTAKFYKDPLNSRAMAILCEELSEKAEVDTKKKCGIAELKKYQRVFNEDYDRQLIVHSWENNLNSLYFRQPRKSKKKQIHLLYFNNHYILIWNFAAFVGYRKRYCERCIKVYDIRYPHSCEFDCPRCFREDCPALKDENCDTNIDCPDCGIAFRNFHCYLAHKGSQEVCNSKRRLCEDCSKVIKVDGDAEHVCRIGPKCIHCHEAEFEFSHFLG